MKTHLQSIYYLLIPIFFMMLSFPLLSQRGGRGGVEVVTSQCQGIPYNERIRVSITRFSVTNRKAQQQFGEEIAAILSNAIVGTNCYQVLSSITNRADWETEITYGNQGNTQQGSSPEAGQALGPQLIITGEITEYQDEFIGGLGVGIQRAQIGFILQAINPQTRQIIFSKSFNKKKNKPGASGGIHILGRPVAVGNFKTQAMADILEEALLEAVSTLVDEKDNLVAAVGGASQMSAAQVYNRSNCEALKNGSPTIMVLIPEVHISRPAPDPAGETEIIRKLIAAGFRVVDPSIYDEIRNNDRINSAAKNASEAASIGAEFGADIIIIGEAFSEMSEKNGSMFSCRARVEARAISTANATILGADGKHAGGVDVSELTASKVSLRNAGGQIADYFLQTFCENNGALNSSQNKTLTINISNASFSNLSKIERAIRALSRVNNVQKRLSGNTATIEVEYSGEVDPIADAILDSVNVEITEFSDLKISLLIL